MNILTPENTTYDLTNLPMELNEDLRYCVLDYSTPATDVDFHFIPLVFLDIFNRPSADLSIGPFRVQLPLDWSIMISDKNFGYVEMIELRHLNDREFTALVMNPIKTFIPKFYDINMLNVYNDVTWNMPRLKFGHILAIPLSSAPNSDCIFAVRENNRIPESLDITKIIP
jgi:hypothetical protein